MKAIELLMDEHRTIERVLEAMEQWVDCVQRSPGSAEQSRLAEIISFLREFVDDRHHAKEEQILFATMVEQGFPREHGPIAVMQHEHELGRSLVQALAELAQRPGRWEEEDRRQVARTARAFASLLREHIQKEDRVLYPMAEQRLPAPAKSRVDALVERFEADWTAKNDHARLRQLTESLIASGVQEAPWLPG
jgi:hemerythrin-like domain-containing protein